MDTDGISELSAHSENDFVPVEDTVSEIIHKSNNENLEKPSRENKEGRKCQKKIKSVICHVCGDVAIGSNFGGITCESCKAFFRRKTLAKGIEALFCPFENNCNITMHTRKYCQKCRYRKCLTIGMRPELVAVKRQVRKRPNGVQKENEECDDVPDPIDSEDTRTNQGISGTQPEDAIVQLIPTSNTGISSNTEETTVEIWQHDRRHSMEAQYGYTGAELQTNGSTGVVAVNEHLSHTDLIYGYNWQSSPDMNTCEQGILGVPIGGCKLPLIPEYSSDTESSVIYNIPISDIASYYPSLSRFPANLDYEKLEELRIVNDVAWKQESGMAYILQGNSIEDFTPTDFYYMSRHLYNCVAKQSSRLSGFGKLPRREQLALLKVQISKIALIRQSSKFDPKRGEMEISYPGRHSINVDIIKKFVPANVYADVIKLKLSYPDQLRCHEIVTLLITAISLFDTDSMQFSNYDGINREKKIYLKLLKEYLQGTYGEQVGQLSYAYLTTWINLVGIYTSRNLNLSRWNIHPSSLEVVDLQICSIP